MTNTKGNTQTVMLGERVIGTVEEIYPYGLFIRLPGDERGYIRRRELSFSTDIDPAKQFQLGQKLEAVITALPTADRLLQLSHIQTLPDPWLDFQQRFPIGAIVTATVKRLNPSGVYAEIIPGVRGFSPRAELTNGPDAVDPAEIWWEGDLIEAVIRKIDSPNRLLLLSIRQRLQQRLRAQQVMHYLAQHLEERVLEQAMPDAQPLPEPIIPVGHGERIVIVEDNQTVREQLVIWFNHQGFSAIGAADLVKAYSSLQQPVWLLLVDIDLAGENGLQLVQRMNEDAPETAIVVMSTPEWLEQETAHLARLRFVDILTKPLDLEEMARLLQRLLDDQGHALDAIATVPVLPGEKSTNVFPMLFNNALPLAQQLAESLTQVVETTAAELGMIFSLDPTSHIVSIVTSGGHLPYHAIDLQELVNSPVKDVIWERKLIYTNRIAAESQGKYRKLLRLVTFESCIGVPIAVWGEVNHALFLFHHLPDAFGHYRVRDAQAAALVCAALLEHDQLEQRLRSLASLLLNGQLAAVLGHEVFNKMAGLELGLNNLLVDCTQLQQEVLAATSSTKCGEIQEAVHNLLATHRDLKDTVALFQQLMRPSSDSVIAINPVVQAAEHLTRPLARKHGISIRLTLCSLPAKVQGSAIQLQQAFLNIMLNAIQQMAQGANCGRLIEVITGEEPDGLGAAIVIRFVDHGPGIHRRLWEKIFELGFTTRPGGSGLGLYITRSLVEANGGRVYVEQSAIPFGATFVVMLPHFTEQEPPYEQ